MKDNKKKEIIIGVSEARYMLKSMVHPEKWEKEREKENILDEAVMLNRAIRLTIEMLDDVINNI